MILLIFILLYIISVIFLLYIHYRDMKKGETIEKYMYRVDIDFIDFLVILVPIINTIVGIAILWDYAWHTVKHFKK